MAKAVGLEAVLKISTATTVYATVANVRSISWSLSAETVDTTVLADSWRTFAGGLTDAGEISGTIVMDPAVSTGYKTLRANLGQVKNYQIIPPTATDDGIQVAGICTSLSQAYEMDSEMLAEFSIKCSSTFTSV